MFYSRRSAYVAVLALVAFGAAGIASGQITHRASLDSADGEGDGASRETVIAPSARLVVFSSDATNLVANDHDNVSDVFVRDPAAGTTERVSVDSSGNEGDGASALHSSQCISADGRWVVFVSAASNLVASDTNGKVDVFVHDRRNGRTRRVSVDSAGNQANGDSDAPVISADGRYVAFQSLATNLVAGDANGASDVFVRDLLADTTERISVDSNGVGGDLGSFHPSLSADGNFVAFDSVATNLDPADAQNSHADVYLRDRAAGTTVLISRNAAGTVGDGASARPSVSSDASFVAFESDAANLVKGDGNGCTDVFVFERSRGLPVRVSVDSGGNEGNGASRGAVISSSGGIVAFSSDATNLVANDTNGATDAFVRVASTGLTTRISVDSAGSEAKSGGVARSLCSSGLFCGFDSDSDDLVSPDQDGVGDSFVHELFARAAWTNYGSGFPGSFGVPTLTLSKVPRFGTFINLDAGNSAGAATGAWLMFGLAPADVPTHFGGHLLVSFLWIQAFQAAPGGASFHATVPDDFALAGVEACAQVVELDAGAAHGMSFTQGLELTIGQ